MRIVDATRSFASLLALTLTAGLAEAEKPKAVINSAEIGLPRTTPANQYGTRGSRYLAKFATWAPIYLDITVKDEIKEPVELTVDTPDGDEVNTSLTIPLPALNAAKPGETVTTRDFGLMPYIRPGSGSGDTVLRIRTISGNDIAEPVRIQNFYPMNTRPYVVLSLGSKMPGFELPKDGTESNSSDATGYRGGRIETTALTDVGQMPDRWFGYDAANLVVLTTGSASDDFLRRLFGDQASAVDRTKREALLEWVRRGGRLVVSVGSNAGLLAQFPAFRDFLPYTLVPETPIRTEASLFFRWKSYGGAPIATTLNPKAGTLPVANLVPRPDSKAQLLLHDGKSDDNPGRAVAVQAGFGLGRLTAVAFDLDRPPFTDSALKAEFWDWVLREGGSREATATEQVKGYSSPSLTEEEDELSSAIRTHVDTFAGVPVISFGWVAVFIVLYILLIGPVEYLFLKKILGRLELTWITFPIIVLSVSAAAYFTAYAVKGRDIRVNKIDVVEVDAGSGRVFGQTWFTIFSPRIDTYTVTVSPAAGWTAESQDDSARETLTDWLAGPRGARPSLVRRSYRYHISPDGNRFADALEDVPIQVWSTKSFSARWSARLDPASPVVESKLTHPPGEPSAVTGTIVNRMPLGEIQDAVVIYAGQGYPNVLGTLVPGVERQIVLKKDKATIDWLTKEGTAAGQLLGHETGRSRRPSMNDYDMAEMSRSAFPMLGVLFHEAVPRKDDKAKLQNASLRHLDQSWRLSERNRNEVIIVGKIAATTGPADEAFGDKYSPSELWLKGMPGDGRKRTPVPGAGRQETYVRLYLPIK